ncbi:hypothetical protein CDD83_10356 [Cordyceps sp. RAO-2017]|nr:hypothetical protein CDD83_10356 [Cordyceps sp. RAO-2017]
MDSKGTPETQSAKGAEAMPRPANRLRPGMRTSTIGAEELSVFSPLEVTQITALDFVFPSRRVSWRQSVLSDGGLSAQFPARTPKGQLRPDSYLGHQSRLEPLHDPDSDGQSGLSRHSGGEADLEFLDLEDEQEYPTGAKLFIMIAALVFSIFLIALDMATITDEFKGLQDVAWYGAVFFMTAGGFQSTWGKTYKFFPLKIAFLTAIFIFEVGSLICGVAPSSTVFIIGRAIAGIGAAGVGSGSYTMVAFIAKPKSRAAYTGLLGAVYGVASVLGPLLGGVFSGATTWRWCFYINLPIGALPVGTIVFLFHPPKAAKPQEATLKEKLLQMDPLGTSFMMGAIITYLIAVNYGGQTYPWSSSMVIGLLVGSGLLAIAFGLCEFWQDERAIVIPRLIGKREIGLSAFFSIMQSGAFYCMIYYLPIYFQAIRGSDPIMSGVQNLPFILAAMLGALSAGIFISRTGMSTIVMVGGAGLGVLGSGLCYTLDRNTSTGAWVGYQIVAGLGLGGAMQIPVIVCQVSVELVDLSSATAMILCFQTLGGAIWLSAAQSAFVNRMLLAVPNTAPGVDPMRVVATGAGQLHKAFREDELAGVLAAYLDGIKIAFVLSCAIVGAAFVLGLFLPWRRHDTAAIQNSAGAA